MREEGGEGGREVRVGGGKEKGERRDQISSDWGFRMYTVCYVLSKLVCRVMSAVIQVWYTVF